MAPRFLRIYSHEDRRWTTSFEALAQAIGDWPGMFFEMDGSFVWTTMDGGRRCQIDGMVYDRDGAIEYIELKGDVTPDTWRQLMHAMAIESTEPSAWDRLFRVHDVGGQSWRRPSELFTGQEEGPFCDAF